MEEINHFSHKDHPLKLIEKWETVVGGGEGSHDHEKGVVCCYGCQEPIGDGSTYGCIPCCYFLHKTCTRLELAIDHHLHFQHPLILIARDAKSSWYCDVCDHQDLVGGFSYRCSPCDFDACTKCADTDAVLKKAANIKFEHEGHPKHTLTLQLRPAAFLCDACKTEDKDLFYRCNNCTFWIHKTCAMLAPEICLPQHQRHPLLLSYSLPEKFYDFYFYCEFCNKVIKRSHWVYHCANCRYFAHIKCALNAHKKPSVLSDDPGTPNVEEHTNDNLLHFPMSEKFTDPLRLLYFEKITCDDDGNGKHEINHWSHDCPLVLSVESQGNNMPNITYNNPIEVCHGCVRPLSFPYYSCHNCAFFLHKYCAELPKALKHQLHDHSLNLTRLKHPTYNAYDCAVCFSYGNTFLYECRNCRFYLDINCAFLPNMIKHISHKHPLTQVIDYNLLCKACSRLSGSLMSYTCKDCNFHLDMYCAIRSPHSLAHRYCKGHQVPLTYPPVEDHPEDFYCDICETLMHPKLPLYHCQKCKNSFHLYCIGEPDWQQLVVKGTVHVSYHKHPVTYVRRNKTPKYVCSNCNHDINGRLILECNVRACNFKICIKCHCKSAETLL